MKKTLVLVLSLILIFCFVGCEKSSKNSPINESGKTLNVLQGEIVEKNSEMVVVKRLDDETQKYTDEISFGISKLEKLDVEVGDKVEITYSGEVMTTYPAQITAKSWRKIETDVKVNYEASGYCGNTQTTVHIGEEKYTFMGVDSVTLTALLNDLEYKSECCKCLPEYIVNTEFGTGYGISLNEGYVRYSDKQTKLTKEQLETVKEIIERIKKQQPDQTLKMTKGDACSDFKGISISAKDINYASDRSMLTLEWKNSTEYEVLYGESYTVERFENGEWISCRINDEGPFFEAIGIILNPKSTQEKDYKFFYDFNLWVRGKYRISTDCFVYKNGHNAAAEECDLWAEFTLS